MLWLRSDVPPAARRFAYTMAGLLVLRVAAVVVLLLLLARLLGGRGL